MVDEQHQEPTVFSYSPEIRDLAGYVFNDLAIVLSSAVDVAVCAAPDCDRIFRPKRVGQGFHEPKCGSRVRVRKHRAGKARG